MINYGPTAVNLGALEVYDLTAPEKQLPTAKMLRELGRARMATM